MKQEIKGKKLNPQCKLFEPHVCDLCFAEAKRLKISLDPFTGKILKQKKIIKQVKVDKFKTNPIARKIKYDNQMKDLLSQKQALENAEQVKSWNKYDVDTWKVSYLAVATCSVLLGLVVGILTTHSTVMEMLQACTN